MHKVDFDLVELLHTAADVLCAYEIQNDDLWNHLVEWLDRKSQRRVIYFSLSISKRPSHGQIEEYILSAIENRQLLKRIAKRYLFQDMTYLPLDERETEGRQLFTDLAKIKEGAELCAADYADLGARVWKSLFYNFPKRPQAKAASGLFGQFYGIPALICGSGPSLNPLLPHLEQAQKRCMVFAAGSALEKMGRWAHFGSCIDPEHPLRQAKVPLFYQDRASPETVASAQDHLLWVSDHGGFALERWFNEKEDPFNGGWNAATFCLALAVSMGCNPIILAGVDFKQEDGSLPKDRYAALEWTKEFSLEHPQIQILNASANQLLGNLPYLNPYLFVQTVERWPFLSLDHLLKEKIETLPVSSPRSLSEIQELFKELAASLDRCKTCCLRMVRAVEAGHDSHDLSWRGHYRIAEVELESEQAFQMILMPIWELWSPMLNRKEEIEGRHPMGAFLLAPLFYQNILTCVQEQFS